MLEFYLRIGHEDVESRKHQPGQHERNQADQEFQDRSKQNKIRHTLQHSAHKDGKTSRYHDQDRHQQEH